MAGEDLGWWLRKAFSNGAVSTDAGALERRQGRTRFTAGMTTGYGDSGLAGTEAGRRRVDPYSPQRRRPFLRGRGAAPPAVTDVLTGSSSWSSSSVTVPVPV